MPRIKWRKTERCQHVNRLDLETLRSQPSMSKNLSKHCNGHQSAWLYFELLRFTSHTRLKAHDYCVQRFVVGWKGRDRPNSLHDRRWRPKGPKKLSRMGKTIYMDFLHGKIWITFHGLPELVSSPPQRGRLHTNFESQGPLQLHGHNLGSCMKRF